MMEEDPCMLATMSALASAATQVPQAALHEQQAAIKYVWKHRKVIGMMTTAASLTGNIMSLCLYFKASILAAMQYVYAIKNMLSGDDPPCLLIFVVIMCLLLIIWAGSATVVLDNYEQKDAVDAPYARMLANSSSTMCGIFDEEYYPPQVDNMNEGDDFASSEKFEDGELMNSDQIRSTRQDHQFTEMKKPNNIIVVEDLDDTPEIIITQSSIHNINCSRPVITTIDKSEEPILMTNPSANSLDDNIIEEDLDAFNQRAEAFIRRVRLGFSMERAL